MATMPVPSDDRARAIAEYIEAEVTFTDLALWNDLDSLSTHTQIEGVEVPAEGVILQPDGTFTAIANLYVVLRYGSDRDDGFFEAESFIARLNGHLERGVPVIEASSVDTSDFYE